MTQNQTDHTSDDQNFKNIILDYRHDALRFFAEKEAGNITDAVRIIPIRQEQLKDRLGDRFNELDTPLMAEWPDGSRKALLFLVEEESKAYRFSIHRLGRYCLWLSELFKTDRVVPVVIFLRSGDYPTELKLGGDDSAYLSFSFIPCDLRTIPAAKHLDSKNIVARLNLPNMKYNRRNRDEKIKIYACAQEGLIELEKDEEKRLKYIDFIDYYANLNEEDYREYKEAYLPQSAYKEEIMGLLQFERREGERIGQRIGHRQGEAAVLTRLIRRRFGPMPAWAEDRMEKATPEDLELWTDRILEAKTIEEVFDVVKDDNAA